jgi:hypothetical protein
METKFTHVRPYISDNGARTSGPSPSERKEIESVIARIAESVISESTFHIASPPGRSIIPYFFAIWGRAGAITALPNAITKV